MFTPTPEMLRSADTEFAAFETERQFGMAADLGKHWLDRERNRVLRESLEAAAKADQWIEPEQERLRTLLVDAVDRGNPVEIEAREYQIWYVEKYLTRAADIAQTRLDYFRTIKTQEDISREQELCASNLDHWFRFYAWGYDPRARTPLSVVPFELYPRQLELVQTLEDIVFHRKTSLAIEKARDEGATELIVRWGVHRWNYREGFSMLLSSRTEDEVDTKKKLGTLFERARFQIRRLPDWMLHPEFDINKGLLPDKIISNANGNALHGQAPTENMGRGDRITCAMLDEFAFWRFAGYPQFTSLSQTTDSILMPSSVAGVFNQFADLTQDGVTPKFEMDWRDNPFKDDRWYNSLRFGFIAPKMTATAIAQEVDRNYRASQPGKVWQCPEPYVFLTWSEFIRPFIARGLGHKFVDGGRNIIPRDWGITRTNDFGKSEGHDWAHLVGAQPKQGYGLEDTHFIFLARNLEPTGLMIEQAVALWREWEAGLGLRDRTTLKWIHGVPARNWNSHEQDELRKILIETYGENWTPWDTDYETGLTTIEDWWTIVDTHEENPFRPDLMGRCKLVFVAPDSEYELAYNDRLSEWFVTTSGTEFGFALARKQIDAYHYPQSELGKPVQKMRPKKEFDDVIDCLTESSMILTDRGEIPIADVTTQDQVMTREGWRPVSKAAKCADDVTVFTLTDADGRSITGTGNHRIWTVNRGWAALRGLTVNDTLLAWQTPTESSLRVRPITDTPTRHMPTFANIFTPAIMDRLCTSLSGKRSMVAVCQRVITSIMSIMIPSTMTPATLRLKMPSSMPLSTTGIDPGWTGCASIVSNRTAPKSSGNGFVPRYAKTEWLMAWIVNLWRKSASDAAPCSPSPETARVENEPSTVRGVAVHSLVKNVERQSVYNLNVDGCPEYFASGILVHNCIRGYSVNWNRQPIPYTKAEARQAALPENIRNIDTIIATMSEDQAERAMVARQMEFQKMDEADRRRKAAAAKTRPSVPRIGMRRRF